METIEVVLGTDLLRALDRAAKTLKTNRSSVLCKALRAHLTRLSLLEKEDRDRAGYIRYPDTLEEAALDWDA